MLIGLLVLAAAALVLPVLTGVGDRRRGHALPHTVVAGLFFPITWAAWYVHDEQPYQRSDTPMKPSRRVGRSSRQP